jgi:hypothetical protein
MLGDFDPDAAPAERVVEIVPGTRECLSCGGALQELALLPSPIVPSERALILECEACDATFFEPLRRRSAAVLATFARAPREPAGKALTVRR